MSIKEVTDFKNMLVGKGYVSKLKTARGISSTLEIYHNEFNSISVTVFNRNRLAISVYSRKEQKYKCYYGIKDIKQFELGIQLANIEDMVYFL